VADLGRAEAKRFKIEKIRSRKVCVEVLRNIFFVKELYKGAVVPQSVR